MESLAIAIIEGIVNILAAVLELLWLAAEGFYSLGKKLYHWIKSRNAKQGTSDEE